MENKFVKSILDEFTNDFKLEKLEISKRFEYLTNYLVVSKIHPDVFNALPDLQEIDVDNGSNFGIDGIAIIINNNLLVNKDDIEIYKRSKDLDIRIIFTQSKTSPSYDSGSIYKFIGAVQNFFAENNDINLTAEVKYFKDIYNYLFEHNNARLINKNSPRCELLFSTTAKPINDPVIEGIAKQGEKNILQACSELKYVKIHLLGADYIIDTYNEIENRYETVINFKNNLTLDRIKGVEQSYIGYLNYIEFLKLVTDKDGTLRRNLFYENVRDYQGSDNKVNLEISETLSEHELRDKFILLNNGITVVANYLKALGSNDYEIRDYQIVNGCQTSTILYNHNSILSTADNFYVPIKIIHTNDGDVINRIIKATNRQTPVPDEAFVALDKFHKRLQEYYVVMSEEMPEKLFYERRSKEYTNSEKRIEKNQIINLHSQIRSFTAIFLALPQLVYNNNPNEILRTKEKLLFQENHSHISYYTASYILNGFQKEIMNGNIQPTFGSFRYYFGLIYRVLSTYEFKNPFLSSGKMNEYCYKIINSLNDDEKRKVLFHKACEIIKISITAEKQKLNNGRISIRSLMRTISFKDEIFNQLKIYMARK